MIVNWSLDAIPRNGVMLYSLRFCRTPMAIPTAIVAINTVRVIRFEAFTRLCCLY